MLCMCNNNNKQIQNAFLLILLVATLNGKELIKNQTIHTFTRRQ